MQGVFSEFIKNVVSLFSSFTFFDFLDICLVAFIVYNAIKFIRQTRAFQLVKGIVLLLIVYGAVRLLNMQASTYIMSRIFNDVVLVLLLLFQPEIRHVLESVGRKRISFNSSLQETEEASESILAVCRACSDMSDKKIGALIVFEKETLLGEIINTGSEIDALVTEELIENIFYPKAPLHDGAAIIRGNRVVAAGCILPLTQNALSSELGTRHRAAVGMSEQGDAMVVVVSEERGAISVASHGMLTTSSSAKSG
ncbi:MAG: diadenylate cyclase CdaA, partial [Acutalibacteraceae bacterium]